MATPTVQPTPAKAAAAAKATPAKAAATKAAPAKRATPAKRGSKNQGPVLPEEHTASEAVAHGISVEFSDLAPSVNRIMNAELSEAGRLHAITLFRDSLGVAGDPNRNPINAIAAGLLIADPAE